MTLVLKVECSGHYVKTKNEEMILILDDTDKMKWGWEKEQCVLW